MPSESLHAVANGRISFFLKDFSSFCGICVCICVICIYMYLWHSDIISFGYIPISGTLDLMIILYLIFWGPSILFHSDGTNLQSHQQWSKIPFYPHPCQDLLSLCFFNGSYSNRCGVVPYCGFYFHSLVVSDVEYLFTYLLSIWLSSLEKNIYSGPLSI